MIHPDTEVRFISEEIGYGIVATKFIPEGTITWVQDELDQVYTPEQVAEMLPFTQEMIDKFTFRNNKGNYVLCWDTAKYVNHSFNSNCLSTAYDFEIAIRDIQPGEELTDDYGYLNVTEAFKAKDEGTSRTTVYPDDLLNFHKEWDVKLANSFKRLNQIPQALESLLPQTTQTTVKQILRGEKKLDSILKLYYSEKVK
ncbi:SET domain-containing protein [Gillisia hiemivivida]|uniref:SET domain-containing protein n=1 Tax=Gillisia hiemivivida TaxID=291190 RepID=A0A5C6ZSW8_9FLAO|nr:SET domain-containing protein [Gillisia hiemivivida]TXD93600.1 SET domain-containing protein [Gillisia hiemivivida]